MMSVKKNKNTQAQGVRNAPCFFVARSCIDSRVYIYIWIIHNRTCLCEICFISNLGGTCPSISSRELKFLKIYPQSLNPSRTVCIAYAERIGIADREIQPIKTTRQLPIFKCRSQNDRPNSDCNLQSQFDPRPRYVAWHGLWRRGVSSFRYSRLFFLL